MEREGLAWLLPFFETARRPLLCLRPGTTVRTFWTDVVMMRVQAVLPEARFYWWMTGRVRRIDLLVDTGMERIGFVFPRSDYLPNRVWRPLRLAYQQGVSHRGFVLYPGDRACVIAPVAHFLPPAALLEELADWILCRRTARESQEARYRINELARRLPSSAGNNASHLISIASP